MTGCYLALDQGGHASRALLFDGAGNKLDEAFAPLATQRDGERVEHDPEELIASLRSAIATVTARAAADGKRIVAAGLATQRSSIACWDRGSGAALAPIISWADRRNAAWLAGLESRRGWIRERTGLVLSPHYGGSKLRWCLDNLPAVRAAADSGALALGPLASYIVFRLVEERTSCADPANASRTQLWDPRSRDWSPELLELFGVPRAALPACVDSRAPYGTLVTGVGAVPLEVVTGDQSAVPFAFGPLDAQTLYVNVGTGAFVQRALRDRLPDAPRVLASVVWSDAGGVDYMLEGTVNGAGSALDWLSEREGVPVPGLLALLDKSETAEPPLFINAVGGLGSPYWAANVESRFVGDGALEDRVRAVIESIAFLIRVNVEELTPHGAPPRRLLATGGLSASEPFCRMLADVCGLAVFRSREPEATARGLAWQLAGRPAEWSAPPGELFAPRPAPALAARFERWRAAMKAITDAAVARPEA